jgi:predicted nucleotide-binding protein
MPQRYLFVSYSRTDAKKVLPLVEAVRQEYRDRALDVDVWVDMENLAPGQRWDAEITKVLRNSVGLLVFVSPAAMQSDWVSREIAAAAEHLDRLIIPVILSRVPNLPTALSSRQWLDLSGGATKPVLRRAAAQIADATQAHLGTVGSHPPITAAEAPAVAADIAEAVRNPTPLAPAAEAAPESAFLVHGHDRLALSEMEAFLSEVGVKTFILSRVGGAAPSLLQRFLKSAANARFAIVILTPDDVGASRAQYEADGVADRALQFRARQNVILELGFFYGLLGWENVFVLYRPPNKVFPNFERPSDIEGAVFDSMDASGTWRHSLTRKLAEAGFRLTSPEPNGRDDGVAAAG